MSVQITLFDPETGQTTRHGFDRSPVRIGRDPASELPLAFPFVSARHALVEFDADHASLVDAGSTNGILREGRRLPSRQALPIADAVTVTIGRLELQIRRLPREAALDPAPGDPDARAIASVHAAIRQLRPLHAELLRARVAFARARDAALDAVPAASRDLAAAMLSREFPDPA
jgi:predicted component of type VI protein secretion system